MSPKRTKELPQPAPTIVVGGQIEARCRACKGPRPHVVMRKVGWRPTFVQCCECSEEHAFRAPLKRAAAAAAEATSRPADRWQGLMSRSRGTPKPYDTATLYSAGSCIQHERFGAGIVTQLVSETVCEVAFETGVIRLRMGFRQSQP